MIISAEEEALTWRLRKFREQVGMTQADAAKVLGLDATAITKIEHGERSVSAMELVALAKAYKVLASTLLDEEQPARESPNIGMKRFYLERKVDPVGISGVGVIAEGVMLSGGRIVLQWLTEYQSLGIYESMSDVVSIHGHNGTTRPVFIDEEDTHK